MSLPANPTTSPLIEEVDEVTSPPPIVSVPRHSREHRFFFHEISSIYMILIFALGDDYGCLSCPDVSSPSSLGPPPQLRYHGEVLLFTFRPCFFFFSLSRGAFKTARESEVPLPRPNLSRLPRAPGLSIFPFPFWTKEVVVV